MKSDFQKKLNRALARYIYYFFIGLFRLLPYGVIRFISDGLIHFGFFVLRPMRKLSMDTLKIAFEKEKTQEELEKICKDCFYNMGRGAIEVGCFTARPWLLKKNFAFSPGSRENLEAALKEGKGVIGISAHFGNFPLMLLYLSQVGYPTNAIIRPARDEKIEVDFQRERSKLGLKTIHSYPRESCVRQSLKALRDKELLMVLLDQNTGSKSGVYVDFFGQKAGTPTGPIIFAQRTGSPFLPIFTLRTGKETHEIVVEPHFYLEEKATDQETVQYNVQKITNLIEKYIRRYPAEWGWMHRRWKSKQR